jgi:hypothetical protein
VYNQKGRHCLVEVVVVHMTIFLCFTAGPLHQQLIMLKCCSRSTLHWVQTFRSSLFPIDDAAELSGSAVVAPDGVLRGARI